MKKTILASMATTVLALLASAAMYAADDEKKTEKRVTPPARTAPPAANPNAGHQQEQRQRTPEPQRQPNNQPPAVVRPTETPRPAPNPNTTPDVNRRPNYTRQPSTATPTPDSTRQPDYRRPDNSRQPATPAPATTPQPDYRRPDNSRQPTPLPNSVRQPNNNINDTPGRLRAPEGVDQFERRGPATRPPASISPMRQPSGQTTRRPDGSYTVHTNSGRDYSYRSNGSVSSFRGANNSEARFRNDGSVREVRAKGMVITHGPGGMRRVVAERPDHTVLVTNRAGNGYVQRSFAFRGQTFANRTYVAQGRVQTSYYRSYSYRGVMLQSYTPVRYYSPFFYGWAYNPWSTPVYYRWGWMGSPWYGYYGGYFSPYPVYPSAALWLTDYVVSASLQQAYQDQIDAGMQGDRYSGQSSLTPDVKQAIADEVQRQLALENAERQTVSQNSAPDPNYSGLPQMLSDNKPHTLIVAATLNVSGGDQDCVVTAGDVVQTTGATAPNGSAAEVKVLASKGQDCQVGSLISVSFQDLQEMQNQMRQSLDQGLGDLQSQQGQGGLPKVPAEAAGNTLQSPFVSAAPAPDPNAPAELSQQAQDAAQADQDVVSQAAADTGATDVTPPPPAATADAGTVTISLDQTIPQVTSILGPPTKIVDLGAKKIYIYNDMKITFQNGKVIDVQ